ncbi:MAG: hypothetical protein AB1465_06260 [Patescibacteria group bacterium]
METIKTLLLMLFISLYVIYVALKEFAEFLFFLLKGVYYLTIYSFVLGWRIYFLVCRTIYNHEFRQLVQLVKETYLKTGCINWRAQFSEIGIVFGGLILGLVYLSIGIGYFILAGIIFESLGVSDDTNLSLVVLFMPWWPPGFLIWSLIAFPFIRLYGLVRKNLHPSYKN